MLQTEIHHFREHGGCFVPPTYVFSTFLIFKFSPQKKSFFRSFMCENSKIKKLENQKTYAAIGHVLVQLYLLALGALTLVSNLWVVLTKLKKEFQLYPLKFCLYVFMKLDLCI
jgi:hypothetical protein